MKRLNLSFRLQTTLNVGYFEPKERAETSETNHSDWKSDSLSLTYPVSDFQIRGA